MLKLLTVDEVVAILETKSTRKIYEIGSICIGATIENSTYFEIMIFLTKQEIDLGWVTDALKDVLNVVRIEYTGPVIAGPALPSDSFEGSVKPQ